MTSPRYITRLATCSLLALAAASLGGCFPLAVVGVGTAAMVASDRRPPETQLTDQMIEGRASSRLSEKLGNRAHINVTSYDRNVLLTGEVLEGPLRAEAEKIVAGVPNVRAITNELQVAGLSSFGSRSNDVLLTTKVKARLADSKKITVNRVEVVTEAGVVYLLGIVTHAEADTAANIARTTGGVRRVVRVFEYISEEQARQIDNTPPPPEPSSASDASAAHPPR
jgi:osmotically-inducible protein OsmY